MSPEQLEYDSTASSGKYLYHLPLQDTTMNIEQAISSALDELDPMYHPFAVSLSLPPYSSHSNGYPPIGVKPWSLMFHDR